MATIFGLIGKNISYSFSRGYFTEKFQSLGLSDHRYLNFDLADIHELPKVMEARPVGLNVTIPYKESIIPFLDNVDEEALRIGAVNTIKVSDGKLTGYNTDIYGFEESLRPLLKPFHKRALVLGTGGASKAVKYALEKSGIEVTLVSRNPGIGKITYAAIDSEVLASNLIIVNCSPVGTFPNVGEFPKLPYKHLTSKHLLYDLVYNPEETAFIRKGKKQGATTLNGLKMLHLQAEKAWEIWNS